VGVTKIFSGGIWEKLVLMLTYISPEEISVTPSNNPIFLWYIYGISTQSVYFSRRIRKRPACVENHLSVFFVPNSQYII